MSMRSPIVLSSLRKAGAARFLWPRSSLRRALPSFFSFSSSDESPSEAESRRQPYHFEQRRPPDPVRKNIRLEAIKSAGMAQLKKHTQDLVSRTRRPLFEERHAGARGPRPSVAQIQEAGRLESALIDALAFHSRDHATFHVGGQCIEILGVEVSPDLKHARAYWCLPRGLDLRSFPHSKLEMLVQKVQQRMDERGGKLQALVHAQLRAYYPPKIKWVPAEHVSRDLDRGVSLEKGKKRWS